MSTITASVPQRPANQEWNHDREVYVFRAVAREMGFKAPFLRKYPHRKHPALGKKIKTIVKRFRFTQANGVEVEKKLRLFLLQDLTIIKRMRDIAKELAKEKASGATGDYEKIERLRQQLRDLKAEVNQEESTVEPVVTKQGVEFRSQAVVADIEQTPLDSKYISLPEAARLSGCLLTTWHNWTRAAAFPLIGKKLRRFKLDGHAAHGHYRPMQSIKRADFNAIMPKLIEARDGRIVRGKKTYLSPPFVGRYFELPEGTPPSMTLQNRRHYDSEQLRRTIYSIDDGHYLDENGKLQYGHCYLDSDVAALFQKKPGAELPHMPPAFVPLPIADTTGVEAIHKKLDANHGEVVSRLDGARGEIVEKIGTVEAKMASADEKKPSRKGANLLTFMPGGFVYKGVSGELTPAPLRILKELHKFETPRTERDLIDITSVDGASIEKVTLRGYISEARKALREAMRQCGVSVSDPVPCVERGKGTQAAWSLVLQ